MMKKRILFFIVISLSIILVAAVTTITDKRIILDGGEIITISNITMGGNPLMFIDEEDDRIIAIFNNKDSTTFETKIFNETGTIVADGNIDFFGQVQNFDDIDGASRFRETNVNNGTSASAVFSAFNDEGFNVTFGLASSNFQVGGLSLANAPTILSFSPATFRFVNRFDEGFVWRSNIDGDVSNATSVRDTMTLSKDGSLNITGNFTGNEHYGEMFLFHLDDPINITITGVGIENHRNVTGFQSGINNGFEFVDNHLITKVPGVYRVGYDLVYEDATNSRHLLGIAINGVFQNNTASTGRIGNTNDLVNPSGSGMIILNSDDVINLIVADRFAPVNDVQILSANVNLLRVGH